MSPGADGGAVVRPAARSGQEHRLVALVGHEQVAGEVDRHRDRVVQLGAADQRPALPGAAAHAGAGDGVEVVALRPRWPRTRTVGRRHDPDLAVGRVGDEDVAAAIDRDPGGLVAAAPTSPRPRRHRRPPSPVPATVATAPEGSMTLTRCSFASAT